MEPRPLPPRAAAWVWPWWLHRQLDPETSALPAGPAAAASYPTGRVWTTLGLSDQPERWLVDGRGLLAAAGAGWALDWWVRDDDRWHVPASEAAVRQRLLGAAPVVETVARVTGGDVVHRSWVERIDHAVAAVEVDNTTGSAIAVALAIRPATPEGLGHIERIAVDGAAVLIEGAPAVEADRAPAHAVLSTAAGGDAAATVLADRAGRRAPEPVSCPLGWATAA
ncbi:MAG: hypothetical protein M0Z42_03520, partial [Actinomycetota bacterium]|nr:hypothetical protein [Actinomycetota bacterium]